MSKLSSLIAEKTDYILDKWLETVREDSRIESTSHLSDTALGDSLPKVLEALESVFSQETEDLIKQVTDASLEHGTLRANQGYNPEEIAREYALLRRIILDTLKKEASDNSPEEVAETFIKINEVLDHAITECFKTYVQERFSEIEELQKQLTLTNKDLYSLLEASKGNFSYLAHEIKAPLTAVIGYTELLERLQKGDNKSRLSSRNFSDINFIERVLQGARHLLRIVNDALELSSVESGEIHLNLETVNVGVVIDSTIALLQPLAEDKKLEIKKSYENSPEDVVTDAFRLQQILVNLISNAIRYTDAGYIEVTCKTLEGNGFSVSVSDTGVGISSEDSQRIFEPYAKAYTNQGRHRGTGLGLAITNKLVERLQGEIELESEPNQGSTFTIMLPLEVTTDEQE